MFNSYDIIIIGAGSVGMAASYYLSKKNKKILLIDSNNPPHDMGSHHGETRIIRHAYVEGKEYVPLVLKAHDLWEKLQKDSGFDLFYNSGVLNVVENNSEYFTNLANSIKTYDLSAQFLDNNQLMKRWSGLKLNNNLVGVFEENSGVLFSEKCINAYKSLLNNVDIITQEKITSIIQNSDKSIQIEVNDKVVNSDYLLLCSGAGTGKLLNSLGVNISFQPVRKAVSWFYNDNSVYKKGNFPAFVFVLKDKYYYGFPDFEQNLLKVGRHDDGQPVDPDTMNRNFGDFYEDENNIREFTEEYFPLLSKKIVKGSICLYSRTPDNHFIIDYLPSNKNIVVISGLSGHGFKFASILGELACNMIVSEKNNIDISPFSITRSKLNYKYSN